MQATLIDQGFSLMLYGMGTVFVFLTILVFATTLMSKLVGRFAPTDESPADRDATAQTTATQVPPQILAAIQQAIHQHRQK